MHLSPTSKLGYLSFKRLLKVLSVKSEQESAKTLHPASEQTSACFSLLVDVAIIHSVLVSVSCPKALYHLESENLFRITVVVADWLG